MNDLGKRKKFDVYCFHMFKYLFPTNVANLFSLQFCIVSLSYSFLLPFGRQSSKASIVNHDMSSLMAQAISSWTRQVRQGRLAKHIEELRVDSDADAGGKPCAEVLPPTELSEHKDADEHS